MIRVRSGDLGAGMTTALALVTARTVLARGGLPAAIRHYGLCLVSDAQLGARGAGTTRPGPVAVDVPARLRRRVRIAHRLARLPGLRATCLPTSLVVARLLHREGLAPDVVIGVPACPPPGGAEDGFLAHAWVECEGWRFDASALPAASYDEIARLRARG